MELIRFILFDVCLSINFEQIYIILFLLDKSVDWVVILKFCFTYWLHFLICEKNNILVSDEEFWNRVFKIRSTITLEPIFRLKWFFICTLRLLFEVIILNLFCFPILKILHHVFLFFYRITIFLELYFCAKWTVIFLIYSTYSILYLF